MEKVPEDVIAEKLRALGIAGRDLHELAKRMLTYDGHPLLVVGRVLWYVPLCCRSARPDTTVRRRSSDTI